MIRLLLVCLVALASAPAAAPGQTPDRSAEVREALARLPISPGVWEGEAWHRSGPAEPDTALQHELVQTRLDGLVLLIEGTGRAKATGELVHHAFATVGWDPVTSRYVMTAWLDNGTMTEAETVFTDGVFTWGFQVPNGPRIRYRISSPEPGVWVEDGSASMDGGATWFPFFGMTLHRTGEAPE